MIRADDLAQGEHAAVYPWMIRACDGDVVAALVLAHMAFRTFNGRRWHLATAEDVAEHTGLTVNQVRRALRVLRDLGHLQDRRADKWNATLEWNLGLDRPPHPEMQREVHHEVEREVDLYKEQEKEQEQEQEPNPPSPPSQQQLALVGAPAARREESKQERTDRLNEQARALIARYADWRTGEGGHGPASQRVLGGLRNAVREALEAGVAEPVICKGLADWTEHGIKPASAATFIENRARGRVPGQRITRSKTADMLAEAANPTEHTHRARALFGLPPLTPDGAPMILGGALPATLGAMP